jgi:hypothetical protein
MCYAIAFLWWQESRGTLASICEYLLKPLRMICSGLQEPSRGQH